MFCLAVAAARTGMQVHNFCVMSNHYHLVATDPRGRLPEFMHWLDEYTAKCINALYGRWEPVWDPRPYSAVRLEEADDVLAKMVYVYANPVKAGLVRTGGRWPGLRSRPRDLDGTLFTGVRPRVFFRPDGRAVPERATLRLEVPPALTDRSDRSVVGLLEELVREQEVLLQRGMEAAGRTFRGRRKVLAESPFARPKSMERKRRMRPAVAGRSKWNRVAALRGLSDFVRRYQVALSRFRGGERDVWFPAGTYAMRLRFNVNCYGQT
jgi:REP element-mobilizing transposase RayT